jgi:hypothetical protein
MASSKIMILGAGIYQVPLILKAQNLGYHVTVVSPEGNYPGLKYADSHINLDLRDTTNILTEYNKGFNGVCSAGNDLAVLSIGCISEVFNLNFYSSSLAKNFTDKILMKSFLKKLSINTPDQFVCTQEEHIDLIIGNLNEDEKKIAKPHNSSGSRGVYILDYYSDENIILKIKDALKSEGSDGRYIVEDYVEGLEFGAQLYIKNGVLSTVFCHGDILHSESTRVPVFHWAPLVIRNVEIEKIVFEEMSKLNGHMENYTGFINCDFIFTGTTLYTIELGLRIGATGIPEILGNSFHVDAYSQILADATNKLTTFTLSKIPVFSYYGLLYFNENVIVDNNIGAKLAVEMQKNGVNFSVDFDLPFNAVKFVNGSNRVGSYWGSEIISDLDMFHSNIISSMNSCIC